MLAFFIGIAATGCVGTAASAAATIAGIFIAWKWQPATH